VQQQQQTMPFSEGAPNCLPNEKELVGAASNGNGNGQA
jgi:hypothetical protein